MQHHAPTPPQPRRRMSSGAKFGIGCGVLVIVAFLLTCGAGVGFLVWAFNKLDKFAQEYEDQGYVRMNGQVIPVSETISTPTVFTGQSIDIQAGSDASIALACQAAQIHGTVNGDVDFFGQVLTIHDDAIITGDVRVKAAQQVVVKGEIQGELSGNWQTLLPSDYQRKSSPGEEPASGESDVGAEP